MWVSWKMLGLVDSSITQLIVGLLGQTLKYGTLVIAFIIVFDFVFLIVQTKPLSERDIAGRYARGVSSEVDVKITNASAFKMFIKFHDGLPEDAVCGNLPWSGSLEGRGFTKISYPVEFVLRGDTHIDRSYLQYSTMLGLWSRAIRSGDEQVTKVYPNYEPIVRYALLTMESSPEQMGIVMKNRVGMSKEFHQLRDYQLGDMLSQIDWKATSKHRSLISRDYQEQKDQSVILMLDCGRRMRAVEDGVPQFDHCLNAMLLLSYVALRQGDHVGVLSFGGEEKWLPPVKGTQSMTTLLNHMYDYQTSNT